MTSIPLQADASPDKLSEAQAAELMERARPLHTRLTSEFTRLSTIREQQIAGARKTLEEAKALHATDDPAEMAAKLDQIMTAQGEAWRGYLEQIGVVSENLKRVAAILTPAR
jgi:hypothetical protein